MHLETENQSSEKLATKGDTGLELTGLQWLIDHHKAKEKYRSQMVEDMNIKSGERVLDLACGPGLWSDFFAEKVAPNGKVVGIDLSAELIDYAQKNLDSSPYKEVIEYKQGDFFDVPYEDESFDIIFSGNCLMYLTPPMREKLLKEQKRLVKKGGRIISKEFDDATTLVYPIPPNLWLKVLSCSAQVQTEKSSEEYYDNFIGRQARGIFLKAGLKNISSTWYGVEIFPPLCPATKRYVTETIMWQIETASPYLSEGEVKQLKDYLNPDSKEYILDREEEFYYSIGEIISTGTV